MLRTEDLFLGALGLLRGGQLQGVEIRGVNGRRMAVFRIAGAGMDQVEHEFHQGRSLVDLRLLKSEIRRLKDLAFQTLREEQRNDGPQGRDRGPLPAQGGRTRRR